MSFGIYEPIRSGTDTIRDRILQHIKDKKLTDISAIASNLGIVRHKVVSTLSQLEKIGLAYIYGDGTNDYVKYGYDPVYDKAMRNLAPHWFMGRQDKHNADH